MCCTLQLQLQLLSSSNSSTVNGRFVMLGSSITLEISTAVVLEDSATSGQSAWYCCDARMATVASAFCSASRCCVGACVCVVRASAGGGVGGDFFFPSLPIPVGIAQHEGCNQGRQGAWAWLPQVASGESTVSRGEWAILFIVASNTWRQAGGQAHCAGDGGAAWLVGEQRHLAKIVARGVRHHLLVG